MKSSKTAYQSYLLRLWCEAEKGTWRASLENVISHDCQNFSDLHSLYAYINQQTTGSPSRINPQNLAGHRTKETQTPIINHYSDKEVKD